MKKYLAIPLAALAFAAACDDSSKGELFAPEAPVGGPLFHENSTFGELSEPTISAPAANATITTSSVNVTWAASTVTDLEGRTHYNLDKYSLKLDKKSGSKSEPVATTFPLASATSATLTDLCDGTYSVQLKAIAGYVAGSNKQLNSHDSHPSNIQFTVSGVSCTVVSSNVAPVLALIGNPIVAEGSTFTHTATATDADNGQTLTFSLAPVTVDGTVHAVPSWASINSSSGVLTLTPTDGPASAKFKVVVTDNGSPALSDEETITVTVRNVAPTATESFETPVDEGTAFSLRLTNPVDPSAADVTAGFSYRFDCGTGSGYGSWSTSTSTLCSTSDNGTRSVKAQIKDRDGDATEYTGSVRINNVAPVLGTISGPLDPMAVNNVATVSAGFTDVGILDTHTATVDWNDGSPLETGSITQGSGSGSVSDSHTYTAAGVYRVTITLTDDDGGVDAKFFEYVVVYDPAAGFVTGGGWINSPAGAYKANETLSGKATFGFVSKYQKGADKPTGNTEFQFHAGNLNFKSTSYDWLVVSGSKAQYKGEGTINGVSGYEFLLTATDGSPDTFRMRITNSADGGVVYDNATGSTKFDESSTQAIGGGSIKIHSK